MSSPQLLAALPLPFDPLEGRIQASEVVSVHGSRLRKRLEIAAAVDGEGISLHSIRNPRLLTSYAIAPHSKIATTPRSIYQKRHAQQPPKRFTYAAIQQDDAQAKVEIVGFLEKEQPKKSNLANQLRKFQCHAHDSPLHSIHIIPHTRLSSDHDANFDILVVSKHGQLQCLSADLQTSRWKATIPQLEIRPGKMQIEMATLIDAGTASRGILQARPDVISAIGAPDERLESLTAIPLLFLLTSRQKSATDSALHVFALNSRATDSLSAYKISQTNTLASLASWQLHRRKQNFLDENTAPESRLCASSARLFELSKSLVIYDLSGLVPRTNTAFSTLQHYKNILPLSSSRLMIGFDETCAIYDTKFNSLQALFNCALETYPGLEAQRQRAAASKNLKPSPTFICSFSEPALAVALVRNTLVTFQLDSTPNPLKRKRGSVRLIDSIQKGVGLDIHRSTPYLNRDTAYPLTKAVPGLAFSIDTNWKREVAELDACAEASDVHRFEDILLGPEPRSKKRLKSSESNLNQSGEALLLNGNVNGPSTMNSSATHAHEESKYQMPSDTGEILKEPSTVQSIDQRKAIYALGKVFALEGQRSSSGRLQQYLKSRLYIKFFPPRVFHSLVIGGYITSHLIEQTLSDQNQYHARLLRLEPSDIVNAIFNFDPSGRLLHRYLRQPVHLDVLEVLQAMRVLILRSNGRQLPALEGAHPTNGDDLSGNNDSSIGTPTNLEESLATVLARLYSFPSQRVIQAMQATLTSQEIKVIITMLRHQLSEGGWLSYYIDLQLQDSKHPSSTKTSLIVITQLLSCAIDAIGLSGWLVGQEMQESSTYLLSQLRAEASMALESIHEMQSLRDILTEFSKSGPSSTRSAQIAGPVKKASQLPLSPALPLGSTQGGDVSTIKVSAGGRVKRRSKREIAKELSKRVPEYSVDRIRF